MFLLRMLLLGICLVLTSAKPPVGVCFSYIVFVLSCPGCCPCCSQCSAEDRALYRPHRQARLSVLLRARPQWGVPLLKLIELSLFSKVAGTNSLIFFFLYLLSLLLPSLHACIFYFLFFELIGPETHTPCLSVHVFSSPPPLSMIWCRDGFRSPTCMTCDTLIYYHCFINLGKQ